MILLVSGIGGIPINPPCSLAPPYHSDMTIAAQATNDRKNNFGFGKNEWNNAGSHFYQVVGFIRLLNPKGLAVAFRSWRVFQFWSSCIGGVRSHQHGLQLYQIKQNLITALCFIKAGRPTRGKSIFPPFLVIIVAIVRLLTSPRTNHNYLMFIGQTD